MRSALQSREDILREQEDELNKKIKELVAKDSENQQLRTQMEELRDQTKEMVTDLQKQLAKKQAEETALRAAKSKAQALQPGFFDLAPGSSQATNLFDSTTAARKLFADEEQQSPDSSGQFDNTGMEEQSDVSLPTPADQQSSKPNANANAGGALPQAPPRRQGQPVLPAKQSAAPAQGAANAVYSEPEHTRAVPAGQANAPQSGFAIANPTASFVSAAGSYGSGVRAQVFEVVVRQALAGAHWREICAVPMQINNILPDEVEAEVKRRQALLKK